MEELGYLQFFGFIIYFIPSFVAYKRDKDNTTAIFLLNLFNAYTVVAQFNIFGSDIPKNTC